MADVFISYSRKNSDFVHKLDTALTQHGRDVWVDWQDIARGQDWWREIQVGIDSADTALIVITENWLVSEICQRELAYIRQQSKRVFPLIRQRIEGDVALRAKGTWLDQDWEQQARENWKYLRSLNWLLFDDDSTFDTALQDLLIALDVDQAYIKGHTRYMVRAMEWQQSHRNPSFLLDGDQFDAAIVWLESAVGKAPPPTEMHREYFAASRVANTARLAREKAREQLVRQSRRATIALGAAGIVAVIIAIMAGQQLFAAQAEVTKAAATLQEVNLQVTDAIDRQSTAAAQATAAAFQIGTATLEQGRAVEAQRTSAAQEATANAQVAVAGATLSLVPPTLTAVALAIEDSNLQQEIAIQIANASLQLSNSDVDGALKTLDDMVATYPDEGLAYVGRASVLENLGETDAALADYSAAIELDPERNDAYVSRGRLYGYAGRMDAALADFNKAIAIDPEYPDNFTYRGQTYAFIGEYQKAIDDYNRALALAPYYSFVYVMRGIAYAGMGENRTAAEDYWTFIQGVAPSVTTSDTVPIDARTLEVVFPMAAGVSYRMPFEARAGDRMRAEALAAAGAAVDPVLVLLDPEGKPLTYSDDISPADTNARLTETLAADGIYTLVIAYGGGGSEGEMTLNFEVEDAAATPTPTDAKSAP